MPGYVERKDKNQILKELIDTAEPGSRAHEQQKTGILLRCTEDLERAPRSLEKSMNNSVNAAGKLATKIYCLYVPRTLASRVTSLKPPNVKLDGLAEST